MATAKAITFALPGFRISPGTFGGPCAKPGRADARVPRRSRKRRTLTTGNYGSSFAGAGRRVELSQSVSVPNRERPPNPPAAALAATRCGTHALDVSGEHFAVGPTRAAVCVALASVAVAAMEDRIRGSGASGSVLASEPKAGCCWIWRLMPRGDCAPLECLASCQD
jgi:hypothetical protein